MVKYLFNWKEIPGGDTGKLIDFLTQNFSIGWVKTAKIEKIEENKTIKVSAKNNSLSLRLNDDKTVSLKIDDGTTDEFIAKEENVKLNVYPVKKIAIACQGGGSHTAFTAGALKKILEEKDKKFKIIAFTGTSGGAECALLAWYGMLTGDKDKAVDLLNRFWAKLSKELPIDLALANACGVWSSLFPYALKVSPYYPPLRYWAEQTQDYLRRCLEKLVTFNILEREYSNSIPELVIGAVNVKTGDFEVFKSNINYRDKTKKNIGITADAILASAAESSFLKAVHIGDNIYWDGLFSQNPPIHDLLENKDAKDKPDEIWVIQIDPQTRKNKPKTPEEIEDRRNELAGNISLNHEIHIIDRINKLTKDTMGQSKYKRIEVRKIELTEKDLPKENLDYASKWKLFPGFIDKLMNCGESKARNFLARWQD